MHPLDVSLYDRGWETKWDDMKMYGPFSQHLRRMLVSVLSSVTFDTLLDVGCGQGSLLAELHVKYPQAELFGLDFSSPAIELAQQRLPEGKFFVMDITASFLNMKFDMVVCSEVLEHIPDDEAVMRNLACMTGKYLIISSPQGRMRRFETSEMGHVRNYAKGELVRKLDTNGFTPLRVIEWGFPFYSPLYRNILELFRGRGTDGKFGTTRKVISRALYKLFSMNSSKRSDEIVVLARPTNCSQVGLL